MLVLDPVTPDPRGALSGQGERFSITWRFTNADGRYHMTLSNGALIDSRQRLHFPAPERTADLTVPLTKSRLPGLFAAASTGGILDGDTPVPCRLLGVPRAERCSATPRTPAQEDEVTNPATDDLAPKALQTPRAAGLAGVLFAVLFGVVVFLFHKVVPANPEAAGSWLTNAGSRRDIQFSLGLVPFCGIFFLWFMGAVRARVGKSEDKFLATIFLGSGLLFVAMMFAFSALFGALIGLAGLHNGHPPLDAWQLGRETTFNLASIYSVRMGAVFMITSSTIAFRLRIHSRVVAGVGYAAGLLLLFASPSIPWLQLVFPFWVLLVSINIVILSYRRAD